MFTNMKLIIKIVILFFITYSLNSMSKEPDLIPTVELVYWSSLGRINIVQELLDNGADPSTFDSGGYSALQAAAENNHLDIVRLLIKKGASVNYKSKFTALELARMAGNIKVIELLLENGAKET